MNSPPPKQAPKNTRQEPPKQQASAKSNSSASNKSNTVNNNSYDEALEFSQSGSDESIDTQTGRGNHKPSKPVAQVSMDVKPSAIPSTAGSFAMNGTKLQPQQPRKVWIGSHLHFLLMAPQSTADEDEGSSSGGEEDDAEGDQEESYENIEGAYHAKDYHHLNVAAEVKDLFQYIERYKPQEVQLDTTLKCFIPEFIPAIGEIDGFIKVSSPLTPLSSFFSCFD
jgi:intraflagellar transport protein 46